MYCSDLSISSSVQLKHLQLVDTLTTYQSTADVLNRAMQMALDANRTLTSLHVVSIDGLQSNVSESIAVNDAIGQYIKSNNESLAGNSHFLLFDEISPKKTNQLGSNLLHCRNCITDF